jgi:hypothetical protein
VICAIMSSAISSGVGWRKSRGGLLLAARLRELQRAVGGGLAGGEPGNIERARCDAPTTWLRAPKGAARLLLDRPARFIFSLSSRFAGVNRLWCDASHTGAEDELCIQGDKHSV